MSMLWWMERLLESPDEAERLDRDRIQDLTPDTRREAAPPWFRCRACGLERDDGAYCPRCLADTMVRVAPGRDDRRG